MNISAIDMELNDFESLETEAQVIHDGKEDLVVDDSAETPPATEEVLLDNIDEDLLSIEGGVVEEVEDAPKSGNDFISAISDLIEEGVILPFDDDKDISEYTKDELKELFNSNFSNIQEELSKTTQESFFKSLSPQLQSAYMYEANGGKDMKAMFAALAEVEDVKNIDIETDKGAEAVVRQYLNAVGYLTPEEVEDEILDLKDSEKLISKAKVFKPKLDGMQEEIVKAKVESQRAERERQSKAMEAYASSITDVISKGQIGGIKLDSATQHKIYKGLLEPSHTSITGKRTNHFGHLLEKYQWQEPNHELILEAYMLLSDPETYRKSIREELSKEVDGNMKKLLKTTQEKKKSNTTDMKSVQQTTSERRFIAKPSKNLFKRP